ncbi:tape measure protein [Budviciaceae bacterium CWB-B4]|uniref:Tape measure protein n=1 Tax=Limnobaculum xujianqingii TaxID=2738837 RepID=A0A9D7FVL8_9GAMM|nr:tape measure protein [Limnobaculum xujianqingii]MBK5074597.1 tape measure protein [Limnobaculum xujianqingii]MBK5177737.1 tape measure protein [Limnobaculum xujianqingii]
MAGNNVGEIIYDVQMNVRQLIEGQHQVNDRMDRMERGADGASKSFSKLSGVAAALGSVLSAKKIADYAEAWTVLNNKLVNSIKIGEDLAQVNERVFKIAQDSRASLDGVATLYSRLERATRDAGVSGQELANITTTITKAMAISGATAAESEGALIQLSQALASGVLRGQEFNSISEQAPALLKGLADSLGVNIGQLRKLAGEGKLTTDVLLKSFKEMGPTIEKEFSKTVATMSQSLTIANNNITKFVGESTSVKSAVSVFNTAVVTVSENIESMSLIIGAAAAIFGSRYVGALAMAGAAQVKKAIDTRAATLADAAAAKQAALTAAGDLRAAQAAKAASIAELNKADARVASARSATLATTAEIALTEAEVASVRTNIAQIESEKALEAQRLKAQITEQGRIATATRMAELQQASAVLTARLAQAEAAAIAARTSAATAGAAAITAAETELSATRQRATVIIDAENRALAANAAAQATAATAARNANGAMVLLKGALGLLGGPLGVAMLAGAGILYFSQRAKEARDSANALADSTGKLVEQFKEMTNTQVAASIARMREKIPELTDALNEAKKAVEEDTKQLNAAIGARERYAKTSEEIEKYTRSVTYWQDKLAISTDNLNEANNRLDRVNNTVYMGQVQLNGGMAQGAELLSRNAAQAGVAANAMNFLGKQLNFASAAKDKFNSTGLVVPKSEKADEYINDLKKENTLLAITDRRVREVTKARMEAESKGGNQNQIRQAEEAAGAQYDLKKAEEDRKDSVKAGAKAESQAAQAEKRRTEQLKQLGDEMAVAELKAKGLNREAALLAAAQDLGAGASQGQIQQAMQQAGEIFDIQQRSADKKALLDADLYAKAEQQRKQDTDQLERQLKAGDIAYDVSQRRRAEIAANYSRAIAEANANNAVNPVSENRAQVDPVQSLANENARKLALMVTYYQQEQAMLDQARANNKITEEQYQQAKATTYSQYAALINAEQNQYNKQQMEAQWQLLSQQGLAYDMLTSAVDAFAGNASNAITGLLTGTMSVSDAMRSLGNTILNSVINSIVQMGVEWVKNLIIQKAMGAAVAAASTAEAAVVAAAWAPAAALSSLATMGGNAAPAAAGITSTVGLASGLAVSGMRKNGGPVSAGSMYQVGEGGMPEIYKASNGRQYMIPGDNGNVISNKDMMGGSGINVSVNIQNYNGSMVDTQAKSDGQGGVTVDVIIADIQNGGPIDQAISTYHNAPRRAIGQ